MKMTINRIVFVLFIIFGTLQPVQAIQKLFTCCTSDPCDPVEDILEPQCACPCCSLWIDRDPYAILGIPSSPLPLFLQQPPLVYPDKRYNILQVGNIIFDDKPNAAKFANYSNLLRVNCSVYVLSVTMELQSDNKTWRVIANARKTQTDIIYRCAFSKEMTNANTSIVDAITILTDKIKRGHTSH